MCISPCCWRAYKTYEDEAATLKILERTLEEKVPSNEERSSAFPTCDNYYCKRRQQLWELLDKPQTSRAAQVCVTLRVHSPAARSYQTAGMLGERLKDTNRGFLGLPAFMALLCVDVVA